jgi:phosphatidylserine/phosphatidylglycerophosphate/cardiolipin synthase-like enzyme
MAEVFEAIGNAQHGVLFLLFSAGKPSILQRIQAVERERRASRRVFFVRGAISDSRTAREFATSVYNDSLLENPNTLITGIAGVPDQFSFWEAELAKLGHAVIHDKVLVIDPFTDGALVATGSHNLGFKASYSNDENLCLIRGNADLAHAYTAHVLDIVNHYNWRYNLGPRQQDAAAAPGRSRPRRFEHLDKTPGWQAKYFRGNFLASRDRFFFPR